ncbi:MAG: hypothetical protein AAFX05_10140 [Planctomycetota bacterium]
MSTSLASPRWCGVAVTIAWLGTAATSRLLTIGEGTKLRGSEPTIVVCVEFPECDVRLPNLMLGKDTVAVGVNGNKEGVSLPAGCVGCSITL